MRAHVALSQCLWVPPPCSTKGQQCVFHTTMCWSVCSGMRGISPHSRSVTTTHTPSFYPQALAQSAAAAVAALLFSALTKQDTGMRHHHSSFLLLNSTWQDDLCSTTLRKALNVVDELNNSEVSGNYDFIIACLICSAKSAKSDSRLCPVCSVPVGLRVPVHPLDATICSMKTGLCCFLLIKSSNTSTA